MRKLGIAAALVCLSLAPALGQEPAPPQPAEPSPAHKYFGDVKLVNQDGREMRLYSDLIKDRTVVIDVVFTSCTGVCPVMSATFAKLQEHLGDRLGNEVYLVSISVDPVNDTPAKLKEYAARFNARPGWHFLTGSKENVDAALRKLGQWVENREAHQNLFLIGNDRTGLWKKALGLARPEEIFTIVDSVVNDKG
jgi:protein SCO1